MFKQCSTRNGDDNRQYKDKITISFQRFQCLRAIAISVRERNHERLDNLIKYLGDIEARELIEIWEQ